MEIKNEIEALKENSNKNMSLSIIFTTLILFVYCYFGSYSFFEQTFISLPNLDFWKIIYHNSMSFVLFFCLGVLFIKFILKEKLSDYGLKPSNKKFMLISMLIAIVVIPLLTLSTILDKGMTSTYPLVNFNVYGEWYYILTYFISYFLYYIGWEFLFRGILLNSCKDKCGILGAILITTLVSSLIHTSIANFGKPLIETLSAIPAGLIFGYFAYKTKSIYLSLYCHTLTGFLTDLFIFLII